MRKLYRIRNKTFPRTNETAFYVGVFSTLMPSYWFSQLRAIFRNCDSNKLLL